MKTIRSWGKETCFSYVAQFVLVLVLLVILIACLNLSLLLNAHPDSSWGRILAFAMGIGAFAIVLSGAVAVSVWRRRRQNRWLDGAFLPQGLARGKSLLLGREYHGVSGSRRIDAYIHRGPILQVYISTSVETRLTASPLTRIDRGIFLLADLPLMELKKPGSRKIFVHSSDETWTRLLLADPQTEEAILRLCSPEDRWQIGYLTFHPGDILLTMNRIAFGNITSDAVRSWLRDLCALAESAERLRPPAPVRAPSFLERAARENRRPIEFLAIGIALFLVFLASCISILFVVLALI
jgi:hypothetical protein